VHHLGYDHDVAAGLLAVFKAVRAGLPIKRLYLDSYGSSEQCGKTVNWSRPGGWR